MTALVIVRALNLICGAVALGIPTMLVLAVFPAFVAPAPPAEHMRALLKPLQLCIWAAIIVGLLSGLTWLPLQAAAMSGETVAATPAILGAVLRHTQFGNVLLLRLVLGFVMAAALVPCRAARGLAMQRA